MPITKKVNTDFFKTWSPDMAYILGFFAADGYMTVNRRGGQYWCIQITDGELLEDIRNAIESDHKISVRPRKKNEKVIYRLQIGSGEMCNDLRNLGFGVCKTKNITVPRIPQKYFNHFVRGYFDGDGNVWVGNTHKQRMRSALSIRTVFTSCSKDFLERLRVGLEENVVNRGVLSKGAGNFYRLTYSIVSSLKLYNFMYNRLGSSKLFLQRKKRVFEEYNALRL